jgi:hypothetical protein
MDLMATLGDRTLEANRVTRPLMMTCLRNLRASRNGPSAVCYRLGSPSAERMITGALSEPLGTVGELMA